jgi:hypothetical protein
MGADIEDSAERIPEGSGTARRMDSWAARARLQQPEQPMENSFPKWCKPELENQLLHLPTMSD